MKHCCDRNADSKACDCPKCPACGGTGKETDDDGGNIGVVKYCADCGGVGKVPATLDDSIPPPVSWSEWLAGCEGVAMRVVALTGEPVLLRWGNEVAHYYLRHPTVYGKYVSYHEKGKTPPDSEIIAELLEMEWPGVEFRWPGMEEFDRKGGAS